ncbi:MAG: CshA/CshB family fibrillar adhesin-related protein, partial [Clostridia bacterium]
MSFAYANPGSGPSAGGIGWFNFGNLVLNPGDSKTGLTGTLNDGSTVTFDIASLATSLTRFDAVTTPQGQFGFGAYTGILGNTVLYTPILGAYPTPSTLVISNIIVKDSLGNPISNYTAVVADGESTNSFPQYTESWIFNTNGGNWKLLTTIGGNPPLIAGVGTPTVTITGTNQGLQAANVLTTQSPTSLNLATFGHEGVAIGFAVTKVQVCKNIGNRINSADQFV